LSVRGAVTCQITATLHMQTVVRNKTRTKFIFKKMGLSEVIHALDCLFNIASTHSKN
jgi:hypothetical protein